MIKSSSQLFCMYDISILISAHAKCIDSIYADIHGLVVPEKMIWVQFLSRNTTVYSKLLPINDLVFKFLIKHLHICSYKFSYRI